MNQLVWKESFNIGIDEIDSQHQGLLKCLNKCIDKAPSTNDDIEIHALLNELKTYADTHFKDEEKLMRSINYPELEGQLQQHRLFEVQVDQMEKAINRGEKNVIASLFALLRDWFIQHIMEQDKRIGVYISD